MNNQSLSTGEITLSIIIVSFNSESFIEKCISSVLKNIPKDAEVIVLDNASSDTTVAKLKKFSTKIKLIESGENLGFSSGNNKALTQAEGEYIFFLNPDTEVNFTIFGDLIFFYKETPYAGIIGPKLVMPDGKIQESVKNLPTIAGAIKEFVFGINHAYTQYVPKGNQPIEVESMYGAAMLIKRLLFEEVGGFDEKFFLYYEDMDLCRRVRNLGKKVYYYP